MTNPPRYSTEVLLTDSRITGLVEPTGSFLDFLNDPSRSRLVVHEARIHTNDVTDQRSVETERVSSASPGSSPAPRARFASRSSASSFSSI